MTLLLDTHTFLWYALDDPNLSATARQLILDPRHEKAVSSVTCWEIAIKLSLGKLALGQPFKDFIDRGIRGSGFRLLPILPDHAAVVATLPFHHRDPFDRMLVAQALAEGMSLLSRDTTLDVYGVGRIW